MYSGGCFEQEKIRLLIFVHVTGSFAEAFELRLFGTPRDCLRRLEVEALRRTSWRQRFRLAARADFQSAEHAILTVAHLYAASSFGGGRLDVDLCPTGAQQAHLQWLLQAVVRMQQLWRQKMEFHRRSDVQDILYTFKFSVERHNFKYICAEALAKNSEQLREILPLAMAAATCRLISDELAHQFFRHLEFMATSFCIEAASNFLKHLQGLDFFTESCLPALDELTRSFLGSLGQAFTWLHQNASLQQGASIARECAQKIVIQEKRRHRKHTVDAHECSIANEIWSQVVGWALQDIDEALVALESRFRNNKLRQRLIETPRFKEQLEKELGTVLSRPLVRPWFVCVSGESVTGMRYERKLLYVLPAGQNFGSIVQASFPYFGIYQGQLVVAHDFENSGEPILVDHTPEVLGARGLVLSLILKPQLLPRSSINYALNEICKQVGSDFLLQREDSILRLASANAFSYRILLPCDGMLDNDNQYYHIYSEHDFQMTTLQGDLSTLVRWVRSHCTQYNCEPLDSRAAFRFLDPARLQQEIECMVGTMNTWAQSTFRSSFSSSTGSGVPAGVARSSDQFPYSSRVECGLERTHCRSETCSTALSWSQVGKYLSDSSSWAKKALMFRQELGYAQVSNGTSSKTASLDNLADSRDKIQPSESSMSKYNSFFSGKACRPTPASTSVGDNSGAANELDTNVRVTSESDDANAKAPENAHKSAQVVPLSLSPNIVKNAAVGAAACASQIAVTSQSSFITQQVMSRLGDGTIVVSGQGSWISAGVASAAGAVGGAAFGSGFGPAGTMAGSLLGAASGSAISMWHSQHQVLHLNALKGYRLALSNADGHMYLTHKHVAQSHGSQAEVLLLLVLAQTSLNGVRNLWNFSQGKMSGEDVGRAALRDLGEGLTLSLSSQGILHGLRLGQQHGGHMLAMLCAQALQHPVPVLLSVLGTGLIASGCISRFNGARSLEQLQAETLFVVGVNGSAIAAHMVCATLQIPCFSSMVATCAVSNAIGFWIYEAWYEGRQVSLEEKLLYTARAIFGLCPDYDEKVLRRRWKLLMLMAHPDRNRREDAKTTFAVLHQCKNFLDSYASGERPPRTKTTFHRLVQLSVNVSRSTQARIAAH